MARSAVKNAAEKATGVARYKYTNAATRNRTRNDAYNYYRRKSTGGAGG